MMPVPSGPNIAWGDAGSGTRANARDAAKVSARIDGIMEVLPAGGTPIVPGAPQKALGGTAEARPGIRPMAGPRAGGLPRRPRAGTGCRGRGVRGWGVGWGLGLGPRRQLR